MRGLWLFVGVWFLAGCAGPDVPICGDGAVEGTEACDDGNAVTETCKSGESRCTVCSSTCEQVDGQVIFCGDGRVNGEETCDDGNAFEESCEYGLASCTVCDARCQEAPGRTSRCGDGTRDTANGEACDDGNTTTEACATAAACTVCDATCQEVAGAQPRCGDGQVQAALGEACDDGNLELESCARGQASCNVCGDACTLVPGFSNVCGDGIVHLASGETCDDGNAVTESCPYGATCVVCTASCTAVRVNGSACGDGVTDTGEGESCDDGNTLTEACAYGAASCTVCDATCRSVAGATSACGDGDTDASDGETCDDGNAVTEACAYGLSSCVVCDASCASVAGVASRCGDGQVQATGAEGCDDGNTVTESCAYGATSCSVCGAACVSVAGSTSRCGDGVLDTANGEGCDDGNTTSGDGCEANCSLICGGSVGQSRAWLSTSGCYLLFSTRMSWYDAQTTCANAGMNLATVTRSAENTFIRSLSNEDLWLGYNDLATDGRWVWQSGRTLTYTGWANGEPNGSTGENCTELMTGGQWNDARCTDEQAFVCNPGSCGNGVLESWEQCDDGNVTDGDGCQASCSLCGNGVVNSSAGEQCDDGNSTNTDSCTTSCRSAACGDGFVQAGEECDDGNTTSGDGCESTCRLACGRTDAGIPLGSAWVREGSCYLTLTSAQSSDTQQTRCATLGGNLVTIDDAAEQAFVQTLSGQGGVHIGLNDKTTEGVAVWRSGLTTSIDYRVFLTSLFATDDCFFTASDIPGWLARSCTTQMLPAVCELDLSTCGNGTVDAPNETCDDGNKTTESCTYGQTSCTVCKRNCQSASLARYCGDGQVTDSEQCDDGNTASGDGCVSCQKTSGYACSGAPSVCVATSAIVTVGPGLGLQVPDDGYDGTESSTSMRCVSVTVPSVSGADRVKGVFVTVGLQSSYAADLIIKLKSPGGRVATLLSLPLRTETIGNYLSQRGYADTTLVTTHPITFADGAATRAELLGATLVDGAAACRDDGRCLIDPDPGVHSGGKLSSFVGDVAPGAWQLCVGDNEGSFSTTIDQVQLGIAR